MNTPAILAGLAAAMIAAALGYSAPDVIGIPSAKADKLYPAFHLECLSFIECQDV